MYINTCSNKDQKSKNLWLDQASKFSIANEHLQKVTYMHRCTGGGAAVPQL